MNLVARHFKRHRWFTLCVIGILLFLALALMVAAIILMKKGKEPRTAYIGGSSMEPSLVGPSVHWDCLVCRHRFRFGIDSALEETPFFCPLCATLSRMVLGQAGEEGTVDVSTSDMVKYFPRRIVASRRERRQTPTNAHGLIRGDLVVLTPPEFVSKEVKRVVGFPNEKIEIRFGDLWVDGKRWKKSSEELLKQSILVATSKESSVSGAAVDSLAIDGLDPPIEANEPSIPSPWRSDESSGNATTQRVVLTCPYWLTAEPNRSNDFAKVLFQPEGEVLDNRWVGNLHDSHSIVPVDDIGVAIQIAKTNEEWQLQVTLQNGQTPWIATIDASGNDWSISSQGAEVNFLRSPSDSEESPLWLIFAKADGDGIVAINQRELLRVPLEPLSGPSDQELAIGFDGPTEKPSLISIRSNLGEAQITEQLVFRDIYYRGAMDAASQILDSGSGFLVLGDNTSLSNDSRQRWEDGLSIESIAGVLEDSTTGIEHLLKQRSLLPVPITIH